MIAGQRRREHAFWAMGLLFAIQAVPIWAQAPDSLYPGLRIKVTQAAPSRPLVGSFQEVDSVFLRLLPEGTAGLVGVPLSEIRSLRAWAGSRRPMKRGVLWGAVTGLALGATLSLALDGKCIDCVDSGGGAPIVIGFTTLVGAAFGLAVGSVIEEDRWVPIRAPASPPAARR